MSWGPHVVQYFAIGDWAWIALVSAAFTLTLVAVASAGGRGGPGGRL